MRTNGLSTLPAALLLVAATAVTEGEGPDEKGTTRPRPVYVQDFEVARPEGGTSGGPLARVKEGQRTGKASQTAASLSKAIAKEFSVSGFASQRLAPDAALPKEGWLVRGVFYARDAKGGILTKLPAHGASDAPPNTEVTVSVADLAGNPAAPFIVFGTAEALRGQGPPAGWNPYVVAAKFVVSRAHSSQDIQKLAREIVDTILKNEATVKEKSRATQAR
ncbi:MAG TPA: hypothetical protein VLH41_00250 [Thermoanaerobaculia bacterium]|nr:hypothetical protein [Thermoanaerobaculia bacterium]